jgi:hypothetical protein
MTSSHAYDIRSVAVSISLFSVLLCWASFPSAGASRSAAPTKEKLQVQSVDALAAAEDETQKREETLLPAGDRQSAPDHNRCR